jgi:ATPase subunit of ABC transporter with duplicated ATPase domains
MTHPILALDSATYVLPDGRTLFSDLSLQFDARRTGIVGRNGAGKSVLARILAGELAPTSGRCQRGGSVYYLAQHSGDSQAGTVADLAGIGALARALARIGAGSADPLDFDTVGERWDILARLEQELARQGLIGLAPDAPASTLSGGQAMRVALAGAALSGADFLILDEPSNHLDSEARAALIAQLRAWPKGLLVISHDRELLEHMERIVELSPQGLRSYGGNYGFYETARAAEREAATFQLEHARQELKRDEAARRALRERQDRRQARGQREGREANQAAILLGGRKQRAEGSAGRLRQQHDEARAEQVQRVREAAGQAAQEAQVRIHAACVAPAAGRRVVELDDVVLPHLAPPLDRISLSISGQQRIGLIGANGCGKSTVLRVLARAAVPRARVAWLDQRLGTLDPQRPVLDQLLEHNREAGQDMLRTWLAQLGLDARALAQPSGLLSGGERLKAALACALYAEQPPDLLLLDEPGNHLDLPSLAALEAMLNAYRGALVLVSHDRVLMERTGLTHRLAATPDGWRLL